MNPTIILYPITVPSVCSTSVSSLAWKGSRSRSELDRSQVWRRTCVGRERPVDPRYHHNHPYVAFFAFNQVFAGICGFEIRQFDPHTWHRHGKRPMTVAMPHEGSMRIVYGPRLFHVGSESRKAAWAGRGVACRYQLSLGFEPREH